MGKANETGKAIQNKIFSLLGGKPIWVWWLVYLAITGVIFGLLSLAYFLITNQWWFAVLIIIGTGLVWGSIGYAREKAAVEKPDVKK